MKRIMFNDRYGLTDAVIKRLKELTRRIMKNQSGNLVGQIKHTKKGSDLIYVRADFDNGLSEDCRYAIGEIVAVAQSYKDAGIDFMPCDLENHRKWGCTHRMKAWLNKMFVRADLMPHQIRILDVRAEKLQDITEEDCLREGVIQKEIKTKGTSTVFSESTYRVKGMKAGVIFTKQSLREAYAALIDKISGKGTWNSNPFVWRIEFELIDKQ